MQQRQIWNIVLGYALLSAAYILLSDTLLFALLPELEARGSISMLKGLGFVAFTSISLLLLLRRLRREEGQRYQALVDQHHAIMLLIDPDSGDILDTNQAAARFYGYPLHTLRGMPISVLNHRSPEQVRTIMARAMGNEQSVFHLQHWLASGETRDVIVRTGPVSHLGRRLLLSIIEDETDSRRYQRELERSNQLLAMLSEFNQRVVRATRRDELFTAVCSLAVTHGGFRSARLDMFGPDGRAMTVARAGAGSSDTATPAEAIVLPIRHRDEDIGTLYLHAAGTSGRGTREQQTLQSIVEDIGYGLDHLDNQQALQVTADVVEASPAVLFRWRSEPGWPVLFVTSNVASWGYSAASLLSGRVPFSQLLHPDDAQRVAEEVAEHLAQRHARFEQVYRILTADQRVRWVDDHTLVSYDAAGSPLYIQGVLTDITERREAEATSQHYLEQMEQAFLGTTLAVSQLVELRDPYTAGHERRVGELAAAIAAELGLDAHRQHGLQVAGALHDVGKVMVPVEILSKPGRLNESEYGLIRLHPEEGYKVLKDVPFPWPVALVALQHHERLDGSGYPQGLKGEDICLEARIIAVADVVESMSSHRPYRAARGLDRALAEIEQGAGTHYDATVVAACLRLFREQDYQLEVTPAALVDDSIDR